MILFYIAIAFFLGLMFGALLMLGDILDYRNKELELENEELRERLNKITDKEQ